MLSKELIVEIRNKCQDYWTQEVKKDYFVQLAKGKEVGHRTADLVDEQTTALLRREYSTKFETSKIGKDRPRSMGDIWLNANNIYHPINVKLGIAGAEGQPNMVSLKKLLGALIARRVDSYYLLIVKLSISETITPQIYLTDMLDHLKYNDPKN